MLSKTIPLSCPECGTEYSVSSTNWESIMYCPFCGETNTCLPYDDIDDDEDDFQADDEDETDD
jgi:hypothetical protein